MPKSLLTAFIDAQDVLIICDLCGGWQLQTPAMPMHELLREVQRLMQAQPHLRERQQCSCARKGRAQR
jgi:hypothetical protein